MCAHVNSHRHPSSAERQIERQQCIQKYHPTPDALSVDFILGLKDTLLSKNDRRKSAEMPITVSETSSSKDELYLMSRNEQQNLNPVLKKEVSNTTAIGQGRFPTDLRLGNFESNHTKMRQLLDTDPHQTSNTTSTLQTRAKDSLEVCGPAIELSNISSTMSTKALSDHITVQAYSTISGNAHTMVGSFI